MDTFNKTKETGLDWLIQKKYLNKRKWADVLWPSGSNLKVCIHANAANVHPGHFYSLLGHEIVM